MLFYKRRDRTYIRQQTQTTILPRKHKLHWLCSIMRHSYRLHCNFSHRKRRMTINNNGVRHIR